MDNVSFSEVGIPKYATTSAVGEMQSDIEELKERSVPYIVFEGTVARFERTIRRLILLIGITIVLLFATNAIWIYEWNQYDYSDVVMDNTDGGNANFMGAGASGVINNGESQGKNSD